MRPLLLLIYGKHLDIKFLSALGNRHYFNILRVDEPFSLFIFFCKWAFLNIEIMAQDGGFGPVL